MIYESSSERGKEEKEKEKKETAGLERVTGEAPGVAHEAQNRAGLGFRREEAAEREAGGPESEDEIEALAAVDGAREEVMRDGFRHETKNAVGGRGKVESEQVRVEGEMGRAQLREDAALRAAQVVYIYIHQPCYCKFSM